MQANDLEKNERKKSLCVSPFEYQASDLPDAFDDVAWAEESEEFLSELQAAEGAAYGANFADYSTSVGSGGNSPAASQIAKCRVARARRLATLSLKRERSRPVQDESRFELRRPFGRRGATTKHSSPFSPRSADSESAVNIYLDSYQTRPMSLRPRECLMNHRGWERSLRAAQLELLGV